MNVNNYYIFSFGYRRTNPTLNKTCKRFNDICNIFCTCTYILITQTIVLSQTITTISSSLDYEVLVRHVSNTFTFYSLYKTTLINCRKYQVSSDHLVLNLFWCRVQFGCPVSIQLPMIDSDGDNVRCRWATHKEALSISNDLPNAHLEQVCHVSFLNDSIDGHMRNCQIFRGNKKNQ